MGLLVLLGGVLARGAEAGGERVPAVNGAELAQHKQPRERVPIDQTLRKAEL